jgi:DNA ligase (NAD+)
MGQKSAQNLISELDKFRTIPLENLVGGLCIDNVATSTVKSLIKAGYDTLDKLQSLTRSQVEDVPGFGSIKAEAFVEGMKENYERIQDILDAGVHIKAIPKGSLSGKSFCFTGKSNLSRAQLQKIVSEAGGEVKKSVGKGLDYLIMADKSSTSSKAQAARKLGTQVISEEDFLSMAGK